MSRQPLLIAIASVLVAAFGIVHDAEAGGIILYELGAPDVGLASAGWAARADDPATVFTNPAGMARLPDKQLMVGGQMIYGQFGFKPDENTAVEGNDGGNPVGWLPGGSAASSRTPSARMISGGPGPSPV